MNFIPIGENCSSASFLNNLELRKKSFPFDWVRHYVCINENNIIYNVKIIKNLMINNINKIVSDYLGNIGQKKINKWIIFPHEGKETHEEIYSKYTRRFKRLKYHLFFSENIFLMISRGKKIEEKVFIDIIRVLLQYNKKNKIIFITGKKHDFLKKYKSIIFYKYIYFDMKKAFGPEYDKDFMPEALNFLKDLKEKHNWTAKETKLLVKPFPKRFALPNLYTPALDATPDPFRFQKQKKTPNKHLIGNIFRDIRSV